MSRTMTFLAGVCAVSLAAVSIAGASPPPTDNSSIGMAPQSESDGYFAPYPGGAVTAMATSGNSTARSCTYEQAIDNPHIFE